MKPVYYGFNIFLENLNQAARHRNVYLDAVGGDPYGKMSSIFYFLIALFWYVDNYTILYITFIDNYKFNKNKENANYGRYQKWRNTKETITHLNGTTIS
jgi:hypothetical protein